MGRLSRDAEKQEEPMGAITCSRCAMRFLVPDVWKQARRRDHETFYCPNGHAQVYRSESPEEKLRRERDLLVQQMARVEEEAASAQREVTRLKKKAAAGNCPCCDRSFTNLKVHMRRKHPTFIAEAAE